MAEAFIVDKKEGAIAPDRTSQRSREILKTKGRAAIAMLIRKPVVGIHCIISKAPSQRAVQLVRPRSAGEGDLCARETAEFRRRGGRLRAHFLECAN